MKRAFTLVAILLAAAFAAPAQTGTWSGKLDVQGVQLTLVLHLDEAAPSLDSPDQGARGIPARLERTATGIKFTVPSLGAVYEGTYLGKIIAGTFTQAGQAFPLTLAPGEPQLRRPQTPSGPFPYAQEEVTFTNGDAVLKGTLVLPEGCSRRTPALVMVTGSGLQNRDEELFEHKPFAVIADALARAGVATLRYDDRGFGESTGDTAGATTADFKDDARAGVRLLRERFDRVGVLGHSEGGTIALMLAAEGEADFIVSLAGAVVSGAETLLWQNRLALAAAGVPAGTVDAYCRLLSEAFTACVEGSPLPSAGGRPLPDALKQNYQAVVMQLQSPYLRYFLALDARPLLPRISCPVLALNGTKDSQVDAGPNLDALRNGLPAGTPRRIEALEGLNHLFQHCTTGASSEYKDIEETFAPEVLELLVSWLLNRAATRSVLSSNKAAL